MRTQQKQFDFGANWKAFSDRALTPTRVQQAKEHFNNLFSGIELRGRAFLDIGFGQGLSLLTATALGANTVGCEINPVCADVLHQNQKRYFPELSEDRTISLVMGSILEKTVVESLRARSPDQVTRAYDIVHAWGVLHHTGDMQQAIRNAASLVAAEGYLVMAIYARHWSSKGWSIVKRLYNRKPPFIRRLIATILAPIIYSAKWFVTWRNPLKQTRGMSFYYNIIDWLGGYPYEYATAEEVTRSLEDLGFELVRFVPAIVPTGCNEFVFKRRPDERWKMDETGFQTKRDRIGGGPAQSFIVLA